MMSLGKSINADDTRNTGGSKRKNMAQKQALLAPKNKKHMMILATKRLSKNYLMKSST